LEAAEELNGAEVAGFQRAVQLVTDYFTVAWGNVDTCPMCAGEYVTGDTYGDISMQDFNLPEGTWYCYRCRDTFGVWRFLDVDNEEEATFPGFPEGMKYAFRCDCEAQSTDSATVETGTKAGYKSQDGFEW
jgi:hypothetical protein